MIDHDIKPKHFKTHIIAKIIRMWGHVTIGESRIACNNSFDENLINFPFQFCNIVTLFLEFFVDGS